MSTQPCKICHGTGHVECPSQLCAHWCECTVCNGTGKVEVYEDWSLGFGEEKVRKIHGGTGMGACEKCWSDAYGRMRADTSKTQTEHYMDLLEERKDNPCTPEEQAGKEEKAE